MRMLAVVSILLLLLLTGCNGDVPGKNPKEKFFRGNVVVNRLDGRKGMIIGKKYIEGSDGTAHDVWQYDVRMVCNEVYVTEKLYEFEIGPSQPKKANDPGIPRDRAHSGRCT
jgi:hypothetical protein